MQPSKNYKLFCKRKLNFTTTLLYSLCLLVHLHIYRQTFTEISLSPIFFPVVISLCRSRTISKIVLSRTFYPIPSEFEIAGLICSAKQFRFVPKSQILTPDTMNISQYLRLRFEMEQQNHQSEAKVFKLSGGRQSLEKFVRKCWEMSENDSELFLT